MVTTQEDGLSFPRRQRLNIENFFSPPPTHFFIFNTLGFATFIGGFTSDKMQLPTPTHWYDRWRIIYDPDKGFPFLLVILRFLICAGILFRTLSHYSDLSQFPFGIQTYYLFFVLWAAYCVFLIISVGYVTTNRLGVMTTFGATNGITLKSEAKSARSWLWWQISLDLAFVTGFYICTMQAESDLFVFLILPVVAAAFLLEFAACVKVFFGALGCLALALAVIAWRAPHFDSKELRSPPTVNRVVGSIFFPRAFAIFIACIPVAWFVTRSRRLAESEELYQSLVDCIPLNIYRIDMNKRLVYANSRFLQLREKQWKDVAGKTVFDLFPKVLAEQYDKDDDLVFQKSSLVQRQEKHPLPGGNLIDVEVRKVPVTDGHAERVVGIQGVFWDISSQKGTEENLRQANAQLAKQQAELLLMTTEQTMQLEAAQKAIAEIWKNTQFAEIARAIAHEIRQPFVQIQNYARSMEKLAWARMLTEAFPELTECLQGMSDGVSSAQEILEKLLQMSRGERIDKQQVAISELLEESILLFMRVHRKHRIEWRRNYQDHCQSIPVLELDQISMYLILNNLYKNACNAMQDSGTIIVDAVYDQIKRSMEITIADTGPGIEPEILANLFRPQSFFVSSGQMRLGLSLSRRLVEAQGGKLYVENSVGTGAVVRIVFEHAIKTKSEKET